MRRDFLIKHVYAEDNGNLFEYAGTPDTTGVTTTKLDYTRPWELSIDVQAASADKSLYDTYNAYFGLAANNVTSQLSIRNMTSSINIYRTGEEIMLNVGAYYKTVYRIVATFGFSALTDINEVNRQGYFNLEYARVKLYNKNLTSVEGDYDYDVTDKKILVNMVDMYIKLNSSFLYNSLVVKYL